MMKKRLSKTLWYGTDVDSHGNPVIPPFTSEPNDLDGLHVGELFLHYSGGMATLWTANESGNVVRISGGEGGVDLSQYLLVSEFNKIWEIKTDSQGTEYIFGKLPVVTQYGITMYSGENMDIPTIAEGLPFDNRTIWFNPTTGQIEVIGGTGGGTGGGSGEGVSNFWDLSGIPLWITNTKPTYSYSEIKNTPDLSGYQTKITSSNKLAYSLISGTPILATVATSGKYSDLSGLPTIPTSLKNPYSLTFGSKTYDGSSAKTITASDLGALTSHQTIYTLTFQSGTFASGSFTANSAKKTVNIPTTTSHISEGSNLYFTNARAVSALTNTLKDYVTLAGTQTITGEKNFTGGLKVNGSPIYYDKDKKYWKLEGDLLVTGGVTTYGNDSSFTPSTIMDAIVVDNVTIIKQDGKLVALGGGGTGGGIADSVAWGNVLGKPSWITDNAPIIGISGVNVSIGSGISQSSLRTALGLGSLAYKSSLGKADVGLGNVENTALSTWIGTNKITTLGTITTGTWNGTKIANAYLANSAITISGTSVSLGGSITQSALRTALGLGSNAYSSTEYLPLTGGTLTGITTVSANNATPLRLDNTQSSNTSNFSCIRFRIAGTNVAGIAGRKDNESLYRAIADFSNVYKIWDEGNDGSGSGLDADLLDGKHYSDIINGNVASATKLATPRTIWGQSFDGTGNIDGKLILNNNIALCGKATDGTAMSVLQTTTNNNLSIGLDTSAKGYSTYISGDNIYLRYGTSRTTGLILNSSGNITIGSSDSAANEYKLYVGGKTYLNGALYTNNSIIKVNSGNDYRLVITHSGEEARIYNYLADDSGYGNIRIGKKNSDCLFFDGVNSRLGIRTTTPAYTFDVNGIINTNNNIYAQTTSNVIRQVKVANDVGSTALYVTTSGARGLYDLNDNSWIIYTDGTNTISSTKTHVQRSNVIYNNNKMLYWYQSDNATSMLTLYVNASNALVLGKGIAQAGGATYLDGNVIHFRYGKSNTTGMYLNSSGNVGIGTTSPSEKLHVAGNILATGGITMYSARKLKNITDERGLSLKELSVIKPTRFTWKDNRDNKVHIGGIADDVMKVLPEVVYKTDDDTLTMDYGNAAFAIAASLIKPVVNHEERIKLLEEENKRLKEEIEQLKWHIA